MKRNLQNVVFLVLASVMLTFYSCRDSFNEEFREVPIINNPPEQIRDIDTVKLAIGFEEFQLDLAGYVSDVEGDPIAYTATSSNPDVASVLVGGSVLTFVEGNNLGITNIDVLGNDGTEGNDIAINFSVVVSEDTGDGGEAIFLLDFEGAEGAAWTDLDVDNATLSVVEQDGGASQEVSGGELVWTMDEFSVLAVDFDDPLDISANPIFQFDYADLWNGAIFIAITDANGVAWEIELSDGDVVLSDPSSNTYMMDLTDQGIDLTSISQILIEKFEGPGAFRMDNLTLGPAAPEPVVLIDFDAPDGTTWEELDVDGASLSVVEQDGGASQEVTGGEMVWTMDEFTVLTVDFDDPVDISDRPTFLFDYADLWNGAMFIAITDANGAAWEIELGDSDLVLDDSALNTYSVDLTDQGIDLSAISQILIEKFEGPGEFRMDNIILGQ